MPTNTCPKCGHQRRDSDRQTLPGICPQCGIAYAKWRARLRTDASGTDQRQTEPQTQSQTQPHQRQSWSSRLAAQMLEVPAKVDSASFWGRVGLLVCACLWGGWFIFGGISWERIGGSFLHSAILPFHEFGHVLFSPFGRFMAILGGSLFQVLMPLGLMLAFMLQKRDNFAASMMLWWCGQSFIDLSPYIADAPYRALPLIRGMGESAHDWGNLLTMTGNIESALSDARFSFGLGALLILAALVWAGLLLVRQNRHRDH